MIELSLDLQFELDTLYALTVELEKRIQSQTGRSLIIEKPVLREPPVSTKMSYLAPNTWGFIVMKMILKKYQKESFSLAQFYNDNEEELRALYPKNNDIRSTIRYTLKKLRDPGGYGGGNMVNQISPGIWCLAAEIDYVS